jgi:hypothetical protein
MLIVSKVVTFIEYLIKQIALQGSWNIFYTRVTTGDYNQTSLFTKKLACKLRKGSMDWEQGPNCRTNKMHQPDRKKQEGPTKNVHFPLPFEWDLGLSCIGVGIVTSSGLHKRALCCLRARSHATSPGKMFLPHLCLMLL